MAVGDRGARERSPIAIVWPAVVAAGPLFTTSVALASLYVQLPRPVIVAPADVFAFAVVQLPALIIGAVFAFVPTLLGAMGMRALAERFGWAATRPAWIGAGTGLGALIAIAFDAAGTPPVAFGLIATSATCAGLCHWRVGGGGAGSTRDGARDGFPPGARAARSPR